eukprot:scaffold156039_cov24-Tisochrysis_lutea.AAC.1
MHIDEDAMNARWRCLLEGVGQGSAWDEDRPMRRNEWRGSSFSRMMARLQMHVLHDSRRIVPPVMMPL